MKKILSIALIAALVLTAAFAADPTVKTSGSATISAAYDLDSTAYGLKNAQNTSINWTVELASGKPESKGEGDLYAEIAAEFSLKAAAKQENSGADKAAASAQIAGSVEIKKANIIYKDITFGILNAGGAYDYAKAYEKDSASAQPDNAKAAGKYAPGFTVSYKGWNGGFGIEGNVDAETSKVFAHVQTKSFELADGVTAQAYTEVTVKDFDDVAIYAGAKSDVKADKVTAKVALDAAYAAEKLAMDVAAQAKVADITVDAYVGTADTFENTDLWAKASYALKDPKANVYAGIRHALVDAREIVAGADCTIDAVKVEASTVVKPADPSNITINAKATYTADFTAYASVAVKLVDGTATEIKPEVGCSSEKLINNATVALTWKGADFGDADKMGAVTASATVKF